MNKFYKIFVKRVHDNPNDLVIKPLFREYSKLNENISIEYLYTGEYLFILAYKDIKTNKVYDLFTNIELHVDPIHLEEISEDELLDILSTLNKETIFRIQSILKNYYNHTLDISIEDRAKDRYELFNEYNNGQSTINPYDKEDINGYLYSKKI